MPNLILIGFMGSGKTSVGKEAAKNLNMKFVDTDEEIEKVTGHSIPEIFQKFGEVRFRSEETAALKRVLKNDGQVIATGGGIVTRPENLKLLKENGVVIALNARPEVILNRVGRNKKRPLLAHENPLSVINALMIERAPYYAQAHYTVDTNGKSLREVADEVIQIYLGEVEKHGNRNG